jgi:uncharacterized protein YggE
MDITRRTTFGSAAFAGVAALLAAYALGQSGAHAVPSSVSPTAATVAAAGDRAPAITVSGTGTVEGTPDVLSLSLGVEVRRPQAAAAMDGASAAMRHVIAALRAHGIATADLQTTGISVQGDYSYDGKGQSRIKGYVAAQQLTAKIRTVGAAGAVIQAAIGAGGDAIRLNGLSFSLSDDSALMVRARDKAFAQARAKAVQYAQLAGVTLGGVQSVSDAVVGSQPVYARSAFGVPTAGAASAPVQAGSEEVAVTVIVSFAIG